MPRIAINGLGRMGKLLLRRLADEGLAGEIALVNDKAGDPASHAHLLEFDSVHGRWPGAVAHDEGHLVIAGHRIPCTTESSIEALPLAALGVDLVIDCTGTFKTPAKVQPYYAAGVRNEGLYDRQRQRIRSTSAVVRRIRATGEQSS